MLPPPTLLGKVGVSKLLAVAVLVFSWEHENLKNMYQSHPTWWYICLICGSFIIVFVTCTADCV